MPSQERIKKLRKLFFSNKFHLQNILLLKKEKMSWQPVSLLNNTSIWQRRLFFLLDLSLKCSTHFARWPKLLQESCQTLWVTSAPMLHLSLVAIHRETRSKVSLKVAVWVHQEDSPKCSIIFKIRSCTVVQSDSKFYCCCSSQKWKLESIQ